MTKKEFFSYLEKRLAVLNKAERDDILAEFDQHINNKMAGGSSEEEAIADFGDPEEFVEEILEAYKVDPEYNRDSDNESANAQKNVGSFLKNFSSAVNAIADAFFNKSKRELFTILLKFLVLVLALAAIKLPFDWLIHTFVGVFSPFGNSFYNIVSKIITALFNLVYLLAACYTIYYFVVRTFLADKGYKAFDPSEIKFSERKNKKNNENDSDSERKENTAVNNEAFEQKNDSVNSQNDAPAADSAKSADYIDVSPTGQTDSDRQILLDIKAKGHRFRDEMRQKQESRAQREKGNNGGTFLHLFTICLKVLVVLLMIPVLIYALCNIVGLGAAVALGIYGVPMLGLVLIALGSLLCVGVFIWFVFRLVFAKPQNRGADYRQEPSRENEQNPV